MHFTRRSLCSLLLSGMVIFAGCTRSTNYPELVAGDVVLAIGDQFTAGTGVSARFSYPELLAASTDAKILNLARSGQSASDIMNVIKPALEGARVKLVILTIGFNDLQQGNDLRFLTSHLTEIISLLESRKIPLMLIGIPAYPYKGSKQPHPIFEKLSENYKFIYEPNAFIKVLKMPENMETPNQFNADGYRVFSESIEARLRIEGFLR